ncbi:MAG TPA: potassium-transporting ATPase subunit B, partial [Actinophytocola sp.]|nr:potassium-transporting ATPase subunit B [Actinophytocola sp.]
MTTVEKPRTQPESGQRHAERTGRISAGVFNPRQLVTSLPDALRKLDPRTQLRNPVMFVVWVGSVLTTVFAVGDPGVFTIGVALWLWFTVLFANLAEAVAEGRGKAQAESLRRAKQDTMARRLTGWRPGSTTAAELAVPATGLQLDDVVVVEAGQIIPGDGDVVEGIASVDESAITGESAPVIRES